jgi:hypothetical protein
MTRSFLLLVIGTALFMVGCQTTREVTLNKDNSGTIVTTTDMSSLIGMAKMSGKSKEMDNLNEVMDTTFSLENMTDSLGTITDEEKALVKKGKIGIQMNMPDDKFIIKMEFPFSDPAQINKLDKLSSRLMQETLKKQLGSAGKDSSLSDMPSGGDIPNGSIEDYFTTTYSKGVIEKKLNKEKYANVESDAGMKSLKEMAGMGVGNSTLIINLPRPVKKADGKNVKLSDDKKKVTITSNAEDFFDDATEQEFRIEY